jgi:hypothetical protein
MTKKSSPLHAFFSRHIALASVFSLLIALTALSGIATAQNPVP